MLYYLVPLLSGFAHLFGPFLLSSPGEMKMCPVPGGEVTVCDFEKPDECRKVKVTPFQLGCTEATAAAFKRCADAGHCPRESYLLYEQSDFCNLGTPDRKYHPMNCLSFLGARTFCGWAGLRLPTHAEWLLAARGSDGRKYPWGNEPPDCTLANFHSAKGRGCGAIYTRPAGSMADGAGPFGHTELAGNVLEWTSTLASFCSEKSQEEIDVDPETMRFTEGGSFADSAPALANEEHQAQHVGMGVRCAKDAK